jgi:ribosomal protein S18 acetylase RimI-like enzyme
MPIAASPSLSTAPAASLAALFRQFQKAPAVADCTASDGIYRWRTPIQHPWFNGVLASRPPDGDETSLIQETVAFFQARSTGLITWWVEPDLPFASWGAPLQAHHFGVSSSTPGMALELADLPESVPAPPGFTIQTVSDPARLETWAGVFAAGFGVPDHFAAAFKELLNGIGLGLPFRHYLGILNGRPAASSTLFLDESVAGIYNVAVVPAARRQGLGAAITLAALQEARQMGCATGALQSSEMGYRVYQRLGFRQVSTINNYFWSAG